MNVEKLHVIILAIRDDLNAKSTVNSLNDLVNNLQSLINDPQNSDFQKKISEILTTLYQALDDSCINDFSPAWRQVIEELEMEELLGSNLKIKLQGIFESNQITPSIALEKIKEIRDKITQFHGAINKIIEGFQQLKIGAEELGPQECEIGILVPREVINNKLDDFTEELKELNRILGVFNEVVTGTRPGFEIRAISSSDLGIFLLLSPAVGASIAIAVERIINTYKDILEIRKLRQELKDHKVSKKALIEIEKHANSVMEKEIRKLKKELLKNNQKIKDIGRKRELANELHITLRQIANRIDKGFNIEIRVQPVSEEEKEGSQKDNKNIQTILDASKTLQFINLEGSPILSLPESIQSKKSKKNKSKS